MITEHGHSHELKTLMKRFHVAAQSLRHLREILGRLPDTQKAAAHSIGSHREGLRAFLKFPTRRVLRWQREAAVPLSAHARKRPRAPDPLLHLTEHFQKCPSRPAQTPPEPRPQQDRLCSRPAGQEPGKAPEAERSAAECRWPQRLGRGPR